MTEPTTAECIEWLEKEIREQDAWICADPILAVIRAKLLAADEMAKALETCRSYDGEDGEHQSFNEELVAKALTAYRSAGGTL